jgi:hypothetical protein
VQDLAETEPWRRDLSRVDGMISNLQGPRGLVLPPGPFLCAAWF